MPSVVAIIPVLNEAGAIGRTIAALPGDVIDATVVVDGGSRDGTAEEARAAGAEVLIETRRGYGRACAEGAARAREMGATVALFLDGDGADPAEHAAQLVGPVLADQADFVLATRTAGHREPRSMGLHQVLAGRLVGYAIGLACGVRYSDMSAFRAVRLDRLATLPMREMTYGWNLEMQMRAARAGLRVCEVALPYRRRVAGRSKVSGTLRGTWTAGWQIIATFARVWLLSPSPCGLPQSHKCPSQRVDERPEIAGVSDDTTDSTCHESVPRLDCDQPAESPPEHKYRPDPQRATGGED